jgi:Family of unknown function (DUF5681)
MTEHDDGRETRTYEVGFGKPPGSTQFRKGVSGNPKGRPRGSKSLSSILAEMGCERVKVTINGRVRYVSKLETVIMQLSNQAANGDLKAIRELLVAHRIFAESEPPTEGPESLHERDKLVIKNMLNRIRASEATSPTDLDQSSETREAP